ncbi:Aldolase-type TIM barrel [Penicillium italicum]|uniref:Aldolase-type TIM barrel n=1 Tax=Penicillium italicum TaxID=40296 RepID=A0A0A2L138_PENIT|nr:Aldolase-type TIM barrel [Penicillium italicum]
MPVDLSLYLVTDSTPAILKGRDLCTVVEGALQGGVTVVQYRDKTNDTGLLVETARKLHQVTKKYNVPLLINDRVDVALAIGAEGVHLGQDDMSYTEAKKLLPENAIIGISTSSVEEAKQAAADGADYIGIGTMFATPTKTNTKSVIGTAGTQVILDAIKDSAIGTVSIGGINHSNVQRVLYQSQSPKKALDGVAIVSAIVAADDPRASAEQFIQLIRNPPRFAQASSPPRANEAEVLLSEVPQIIRKMVEVHPLVHNMINFVVSNFVANVALSIGASPIMSPYGDEATDLCKFDGALLINMGTLTSESVPNYLKAIKAYNERDNPVVYDPVGAAATHVRRNAVTQLMAGGYFDLIKGNEGEIRQVWGSSTVQQRGVDSGPSTLDGNQKATLARDLARRERNVVLLTGATDYLSDGKRVIAVENGHPYLGQVTGTGCAIGTISGCFLAAHRSDRLLAVLSGILMYEIAAENAAAKEYVRGPGSFVPAFVDELYAIRTAAANGDDSWQSRTLAIHGSICDIQEKFRAIYEFPKLVSTTDKMLRAASTLQIPVYITTQSRAKLGNTVPELQQHLTGPHILADVDKTLFSMITPEIEKLLPAPDSTPLDVIVVGIETHICVTQTTLDLLKRGHRVYILVDGVSSMNSEERGIALDRLRDAGAIVTSSESVLFEILGDASHEAFRAVSGLVRETKESTKEALGVFSKI